MMRDPEDIRLDNGDLAIYGDYRDGKFSPQGYPMIYTTADGGCLCAACANGGNGSRAAETLDKDCPDDDQWRVVDFDVVNDEQEVRCSHCNTIIMFAAQTVTIKTLIELARDLIEEDEPNEEYERALVELICNAAGVPMDVTGDIAVEIGVVRKSR
jgi:hypothetical protein